MNSLDAMKRRAELQLTNGLEWLRRYSFKITVVSPIGIPNFLAWYTRFALELYSSMTGCRPRFFTPPSTSYFSFAKRAILQSVSTFRTAAADPLGMKSSALIIDTVPPLPSQPDFFFSKFLTLESRGPLGFGFEHRPSKSIRQANSTN